MAHNFELIGRKEEDERLTFSNSKDYILIRKERNLKGVEGLKKIGEEDKSRQPITTTSLNKPFNPLHCSDEKRMTN